jgi:hypothetical protein
MSNDPKTVLSQILLDSLSKNPALAAKQRRLLEALNARTPPNDSNATVGNEPALPADDGSAEMRPDQSGEKAWPPLFTGPPEATRRIQEQLLQEFLSEKKNSRRDE